MLDYNSVVKEINTLRAEISDKLDKGEAQPCKTLVLAALDTLRARCDKLDNQLTDAMAAHYGEDAEFVANCKRLTDELAKRRDNVLHALGTHCIAICLSQAPL